MKNYILFLFLLAPLKLSLATTQPQGQAPVSLCRSKLGDASFVVEGTEIGHGAVGVVRVSKDASGKINVIKSISLDEGIDPREIELMQRAVMIASTLNSKLGEASPVVATHSINVEGATAQIKMDLIDGLELNKQIELSLQNDYWTPQSLVEVLDIVLAAIQSSRVLSEHNVIHSDLRADNIMIFSPKNGIWQAKIIDPDSLADINPETKGLLEFPLDFNTSVPELKELSGIKTLHNESPLEKANLSRILSRVGIPSMTYALAEMIHDRIISPFETYYMKSTTFHVDEKVLEAIHQIKTHVSPYLDKNPNERPSLKTLEKLLSSIRDHLKADRD